MARFLIRRDVTVLAGLAILSAWASCGGARQPEAREVRDLPVHPVEVTVYPVTTAPDGRPLPLNPSVYRIDVQNQSVITWTPAVNEAPRRLVKCAVRDAYNWSCEYPDASGTVEMQAGAYRTDGRSGMTASTLRYVTKREWDEAQAKWR